MKTKLRGHHLICLNFFRGEGYSDDFIENIYEVLKREKVEIVAGWDEVCSKCPYLKGGKCANKKYSDEMILAQDREALRLLDFTSGKTVDWKTIVERIPDILDEWKAQFCGGCGYKNVCFK
jgi:hypothetical protein